MTHTIEHARQDGSSRFRWSERGTGEPVLLLHGLLGEIAHWAASLEALAGCCHPMALTLPIFEPWLAETSPMELSACVRTFLDSQGISQAVIGGNSLGGHVALELALADPDRVSGLTSPAPPGSSSAASPRASPTGLTPVGFVKRCRKSSSTRPWSPPSGWNRCSVS